MSDEEADIVNEDLEVPVAPAKPEKKKKVMTPEALERLAKARIRAAEVKRAMRAAKTEKETEIKEKVKKEQLEKMEKKVRNSMIDLSVDAQPATPKEESLEEQVEIIHKPKKNKKKVVVMHDSGSDSDSETQVIYIPRKKTTQPKQTPPPEQTPSQPLAFGSIPRYQLHNFNHNRSFY
jgi:hypothetical protein